MASVDSELQNSICHVVAIPYPGRGHINPMMSLCKKIANSSKHNLLITFVVTKEWLAFIDSDYRKPHNIHLRSIPDVLPSELVREADFDEFFRAVSTKMEAPLELLLDLLEPRATLILADTFLAWSVGVGIRRNIPVASFFPMSGMVFSLFLHYELLAGKGQYQVDLFEKGDEYVEYIPGVSPTRLRDLPSFHSRCVFDRVMEAFAWVPKAQYLLLATIHELEPQVIHMLRMKFSFPVYTIGPAIPYFELQDDPTLRTFHDGINYLKWLDYQANKSVLYVSLGSFLAISSAQMNEFAAGLGKSGVPFLWVARGETAKLKEISGERGLIISWCDQLRVLSHPSVGGFWSHCGWNSVQEGLFAGIPFLTFPIVIDQNTNSKIIVEDWKIGYRVKNEVGEQTLVTKDEIARLVQKLMDLESDEGKEMRIRARKLQEICQHAIVDGGSYASIINAFIQDISCQNC